LIELLVALAIIGILVGLLMPGVQIVRCNARMVKCISNLRQLGVACIMYEQDYDALPGSLAELAPYKDSMYAHKGMPSSDRVVLKHLFVIKDAHADYPPLAPYYQSQTDILKCPAAPHLEVGYALNKNLAGKPTGNLGNILLMADSKAPLIETFEHIDFRHCKENKANVISTKLKTSSFSEEEILEIPSITPIPGITEWIFVGGPEGRWEGGMFGTKVSIGIGPPPTGPGQTMDIQSPSELPASGPDPMDPYPQLTAAIYTGGGTESYEEPPDSGNWIYKPQPFYMTGYWVWVGEVGVAPPLVDEPPLGD